MTTKSRIAIFASGSGSNAEVIFNFFEHHPSIEIVLLLSNNQNAGVLERSQKSGVPSKIFTRVQFYETDEVLSWLRDAAITHVVLAGFLWLIPQNILKSFPDHIINIHPALLPKFGGKGMYGNKVHEAVKAAGEKETGITIHVVNERYDDGDILFQARCKVEPNESVEHIARKTLTLEHANYPLVIEEWVAKFNK